MLEILERNLECLKQSNKTTDKGIEFLKRISRNTDKNIEPTISKDGRNNILFSNGINSVYLHSKYNVEKETERWVGQFDKEQYDVLLVFGLGMGYHIKKFHEIHPDTPILVLEPNQNIFIHALKHEDLTSVLAKDHIKFIVGDDITNQLKELFIVWTQETYYSKYYISCLTSYASIYSEKFNDIKEIIRKINNTMSISLVTEKTMNKLWIRNTILNSRYALNDISAQDFIGKFSNLPLVIVAAGPSLQKNIHILKKFQNNVFIVGAGGAVGVLRKHNIKPDMIALMDGQQIEQRVFDSAGDNFEYILYASILYNKILDNCNKKRIHMPLDFTRLDSWLDNVKGTYAEKRFKSGPSITNPTYDVAVRWGFNPIIWVGQDLAFIEEKTHADGSANIQKINNKDKNFIKTRDIYGNEVYTIKAFTYMQQWFEEYNERFKEDLPEVINCTEGGAGIKNIPNKSLEEVLNKLDSRIENKHEYMDRVYKEIKESKGKKIDVLDALNKLKNQLIIAKNKINEIIHMMNKFIIQYENNEYSDEGFENFQTEVKLVYETVVSECSDIEDFLKSGNRESIFARKNRKLMPKLEDDDMKKNILNIKGSMNQLTQKLQEIWVVEMTIQEAIDTNK